MFSLTIYRLLTNELDREFHRISQRYEQTYGAPPLPLPEPESLQAAEDRIRNSLVFVNLIIFGVAGLGGYILAGVTLKPIQEMIDEQHRFVADASHELRTPLTSLKSEIEVYLRGKNHTVKESDELLHSNLEEVNKLQNLSDSLIQLSQQQNVDVINLFTDVSLTEMLQIAKGRVEKAAKQKGIIIKLPEKNFTVIGNKENLIQLFTIFLDNAIKYSPEKSTVTISAKKADHSVYIAIADEGIGIAKEDMPHIFDRFYRADVSRSKQNIAGYGLGLSIAKNIIDAHNGHIDVKSEKGKGSTFRITLPLAK